jgi:hypothetical protein
MRYGIAEMTDHPMVRALASAPEIMAGESSVTLVSAAVCIRFKRSNRV